MLLSCTKKVPYDRGVRKMINYKNIGSKKSIKRHKRTNLY